MRVYYDRDADISRILDKKIAIVGYGSQGRAHALNLTDSGCKNVAVALKPGSASLHRADNRRLHAAAIGIAVHDAYAGRGAGSALMTALVALADDWLNIRRLELTVYVDNARAIALYERLGFEREGLHRDYAWRAGAYVDAVAMARLRA